MAFQKKKKTQKSGGFPDTVQTRGMPAVCKHKHHVLLQPLHRLQPVQPLQPEQQPVARQQISWLPVF